MIHRARFTRRGVGATGATLVLLVPLLVATAPAAAQFDAFAAQRQRLVQRDLAGAGIANPRVLESVRTTPRHEFMPLSQRPMAYFDMALPIGEGQTISPPYVVAFMTEKLDPQPHHKVLEIGTGSGYQAAILAPLVREVYTIEIVEPLGRRAEQTLRRLGYDNVHVRIGDGYLGWPEQAPFDSIIVTCSPERVPQPLIDQLAEGGRMVIPLGERFQQMLFLYRKVDGQLEAEPLEGTMFVPMTGQAEQLREVLPDSSRPALVNGGFEELLDEQAGIPTAWYYLRQAQVVSDAAAPEGSRYLRISSDTFGRNAQLLQAVGVDPAQVSRLAISFQVRGSSIRPSPRSDERPRLMVSFYDENRAPVGFQHLGRWSGTFDWTNETFLINVPARARTMIVGLGLWGSVGELCIDDVRLLLGSSNPSILPR